MPNDDALALADRIAQLAITTYTSLPRNLKPTVRSNGVPEWTILSAIILSHPTPEDGDETQLQLVSLGTGVKCLPTNRLPPCGDTLHDCHAEVLAKRGFGRYLLEEAVNSCEGRESRVIERVQRKFRLRVGVGVHLYISALPCGNASSLYTAANQPISMATLKSSSSAVASPNTDNSTARGRNGYSNTSTLRTKPGRPDSFPSISMSCTDKIASWCVLGLQGGLLARWFEPVYLDSIVVSGVGEPPDRGEVVGWQGSKEEWGKAIRKEAEEALYGRLSDIETRLHLPFRLTRPIIHLTPISFPYDKSTIQASHSNTEPVPQPTSVLHYLDSRPVSTTYTTENLYQGCDRRMLWKAPGLTSLPDNRRSGVCKLEMFRAAVRLERLVNADWTRQERDEETRQTYHEYKQGTSYQAAKILLRGVPTVPRLLAGFEKCGPLQITAESKNGEKDATGTGASNMEPPNSSRPPFVGWIVAGGRWESFDSDGLIVDNFRASD